jgi:hypothetical protein
MAGDVAVANAGQAQGVISDGAKPLAFISVVASIGAGYEFAAMNQ